MLGLSCSTWDFLPAVACSMWDLSSLTRDGTPVPCLGKQNLNPWTTREATVTSVLSKRYIKGKCKANFLHSGTCHFYIILISNIFQVLCRKERQEKLDTH